MLPFGSNLACPPWMLLHTSRWQRIWKNWASKASALRLTWWTASCFIDIERRNFHAFAALDQRPAVYWRDLLISQSNSKRMFSTVKSNRRNRCVISDKSKFKTILYINRVFLSFPSGSQKAIAKEERAGGSLWGHWRTASYIYSLSNFFLRVSHIKKIGIQKYRF